jgi:hypothetical protein
MIFAAPTEDGQTASAVRGRCEHRWTRRWRLPHADRAAAADSASGVGASGRDVGGVGSASRSRDFDRLPFVKGIAEFNVEKQDLQEAVYVARGAQVDQPNRSARGTGACARIGAEALDNEWGHCFAPDAERVLAESVKAVGITVTVGDVGAETGRGAGGVGSGGRGGGEEG